MWCCHWSVVYHNGRLWSASGHLCAMSGAKWQINILTRDGVWTAATSLGDNTAYLPGGKSNGSCRIIIFYKRVRQCYSHSDIVWYLIKHTRLTHVVKGRGLVGGDTLTVRNTNYSSNYTYSDFQFTLLCIYKHDKCNRVSVKKNAWITS